MKLIEKLDAKTTKKDSNCSIIKNLVKMIIRKGIPDYFRGILWRYSMDMTERRKFPKLYKQILKMCTIKDDYTTLIINDLKRLKPIKTQQEIERNSW